MIRKHSERLRLLLWAALLTMAMTPALPAHAVCVGDCDGDNRVSIVEAQNCVNLAANLPAPPCEVADQNGDGHVDPNEVDACIQSFLDPSTCPMVFTPAATLTPPPSTSTPVSTHTLPPPTSTATVAFTSTPTRTSTRTPSPAPPTPTATSAPPCPIAAGVYTTTQVSSPAICAGGPKDGQPCTQSADCPGPQAGYVPFCGGSLKVYTFAPFPFPAGGKIVQDVAAATMPDCVHDTVVPFPGGFTAPNFCVPALGYTVSVTQTGCGIGKMDSNGGSDFTVNEVNDTSDSSSTCNLPQMGCPPGPPKLGADASSRVDITVGDGTPDTCVGGSANAIVTVPVHTVTWQDNSPGTFGSCGGDGVFNAPDAIITQFDQILDFTTDSTKSKWMDIDSDGCYLSGGGPAGGQATITGRCLDIPSGTVTTVAAGGFGSTGTPNDGSFATRLANIVTGPAAPMHATCASPPAINFSGTATRCIH
jgi:hypothetical protein